MPPHLTLKHITSLTFGLPYLSSTSGVRSTRQLLAALPAKPSPKHAAVPQVIVQATKGAEAWIEAVYSDKKKLRVDTGSDMTVEQLFRKVRARERERENALAFLATQTPSPPHLVPLVYRSRHRRRL